MNPTDERFLQLYMPHQHALWRFVRSLVHDRHEAEDVVSETVLMALEGFNRIKDEKAFLSFLFTIASRIVGRRKWRGRLFTEYNHLEAEQRVSAHPQPDIQADVSLLYEAIGKLPERMREAIVLFEISGYSIEEIRDIQGGSLSGVKSRLVRARKQLGVLLGISSAEPASQTINASSKADVRRSEGPTELEWVPS